VELLENTMVSVTMRVSVSVEKQGGNKVKRHVETVRIPVVPTIGVAQMKESALPEVKLVTSETVSISVREVRLGKV